MTLKLKTASACFGNMSLVEMGGCFSTIFTLWPRDSLLSGRLTREPVEDKDLDQCCMKPTIMKSIGKNCPECRAARHDGLKIGSVTLQLSLCLHTIYRHLPLGGENAISSEPLLHLSAPQAFLASSASVSWAKGDSLWKRESCRDTWPTDPPRCWAESPPGPWWGGTLGVHLHTELGTWAIF